ncbi:MAG: metal-sensitive transcriptional regulator [Chthoniobacterales bacterium]
MTEDARVKITRRLKRITGQVAGIDRMVADDRYCVDILNQISAVRAALDALGIELLTDHVENCVVGKSRGQGHQGAKTMTPPELIAELRTVLSRFLK